MVVSGDQAIQHFPSLFLLPSTTQSLAIDSVVSVQVDMSVIEKAVDCLRILTTGNEANKVALLTSASGLPCLVRLMETSPDQVHCPTKAAYHAQTSIMGLMSNRPGYHI